MNNTNDKINNTIEENIIFYVGTKKYDATKFLEFHPGGKKCLINQNGKDVTVDYNFHSKDAQLLWEKFRVIDKNESEYKHKNICTIM